ncbi:hypothetical protein PG994_013647 [Apiospora phragmitis]|uniref:Isopenicillin N synthase-like Fe(2+) 2OG dioxygenase domain-containing protein n=1 Tax=Apiospora phragmitis TaxID=2905665 RepID=A0ABR1T991_9PEZI
MTAAAVLSPSSQATSEIPAYHQVPETEYELGVKVEWADLATLDLSKFDQPGGNEELSSQLFEAIRRSEQVDQQFAIGKEVFQLPTEEKQKYRADLEHGGYNGYKPLGLRHQETRPGIFDNTEIYNIPKFIPALEQAHPDVIHAHRREIEAFVRYIHENVVGKLLVLFARVLELPDDDYVLRSHRYAERSDCHLRYMKYHRRTPSRIGRWVCMPSPTSTSTSVSGEEAEGGESYHSWKWVEPLPGSITVNIADSLEFLTNGFLKSSIHRVVAPPPDQAEIDRLGVLYFVRPEDSLELKPVVSRVLERLGYDESTDGGAVGITAGEWVKARVASGVSRGNRRGVMCLSSILWEGKSAKYYD